MSIRYKTLLLASLLSATLLTAQEYPNSSYQGKTAILPFASYTPETRLMFGVFVMQQFKPPGADTMTRASQILYSGIYTLRKQFILECIPTVILPEEKWQLDGYYQYVFFPDNYWGVGAFTEDKDEMNVEYRRFNFRQAFLRRISQGLYAGPHLRWSKMYNLEFTNPENGPINAESIPGGTGSVLPGFGFSLRWDKRNSITYPIQNHFLELTAMFYPGWLGASHPHRSLRLDARKYFDLRDDGRSVLAFHARFHLTRGKLPFQEYALLGGREIMRGYYEGRFRDANAFQIQAELRQHITGRFGLAVFAATGDVWGTERSFNLNNPKIAGGAGLRFNLNPNDTSNIRIDYGIGRHGGGLYVTIGEAF